jgi:hypothetical protein
MIEAIGVEVGAPLLNDEHTLTYVHHGVQLASRELREGSALPRNRKVGWARFGGH